VHVEITTLVIPGVNDADAVLGGIAQRISADLGAEVPWHVTAYRPAYQFTAPSTPSQTLERAWQIGKDAGLMFVYTGNLPGHRYENTYCPRCGTLLIERLGFDVLFNAIPGGQCPRCGRHVAGVWGGDGWPLPR
jgi:pyruvate formate lyase activating enzyme